MYRRRRVISLGLILASLFMGVYFYSQNLPGPAVIGKTYNNTSVDDIDSTEALAILDSLDVKGRAPKTGYTRNQFGNGWAKSEGCDMRNTILARDLVETVISEDCKVQKGILNDPYTGTVINFERGESSAAVQIDHVIALSNAWQTGAQQLSEAERISLANDPLNLLAASGQENQIKGDGDAATWLPKYKPFRCQYITRQIQVRQKYHLWVTAPEKSSMTSVLSKCP